MANALSARAASSRPESVNKKDVLFDRVIAAGEATVSDFLATIRTMTGDLSRPCLMMSAPLFKLGEFDDVFDPALGSRSARYVILNPMKGWSSSRIASILLSDEVDARTHLLAITVCLLSIDEHGEANGNGERCLALINRFICCFTEHAKKMA